MVGHSECERGQGGGARRRRRAGLGSDHGGCLCPDLGVEHAADRSMGAAADRRQGVELQSGELAPERVGHHLLRVPADVFEHPVRTPQPNRSVATARHLRGRPPAAGDRQQLKGGGRGAVQEGPGSALEKCRRNMLQERVGNREQEVDPARVLQRSTAKERVSDRVVQNTCFGPSKPWVQRTVGSSARQECSNRQRRCALLALVGAPGLRTNLHNLRRKGAEGCRV